MAETQHTGHSHAAHGDAQASHGGGYEKTDVDIVPVVQFAGALIVSTVLIAFAIAWLFNVYQERARTKDVPDSPMEKLQKPPQAPLLQVSPNSDMKQMRQAEAAILGSYAWIVREAGLVRIPIDRAKELVLERGFPVRPQAPMASGTPKPQDTQLDPQTKGPDAPQPPSQPPSGKPHP